jgi:cytochrome oxidase Cu insertion factor (SCO1/SenC/PrrC family)
MVHSTQEGGSDMATCKWKHLWTAAVFAAMSFMSIATAQALGVGDKAPGFALPASTGKEIKLADFAGKKAVVLFFYIGAFTNT